jgi:thioredoxin 1
MTTIGVVLGIFAALLISLQLVIVINSRRRRGRRILGVGGPLGEAVNSGDRVLAYFYSTSCAECKAQTPIIDTLQKEYHNIFKVDVAEHFEAARAFGVLATPTTVMVDQGKVVDVYVGTRTEAFFRDALL